MAKKIKADRNKTEVTLRVVEAAANWLMRIGCKPVLDGGVGSLAKPEVS